MKPGRRNRILLVLGLAVCAGGCNPAPDADPKGKKAEAEPDTIVIPQTVTALAPGTTPMPERVAVLGLLNKRNGISQELTLKPGQAMRVGDVVVRLRACETTAPWEAQKLTGALVQLDVRNPQGQFQRVFSGWLYKETPSLNVVEHPVYDVWPKSCAMTHPDADASTTRAGSASSNRSRAPNSTTGRAPAADTAPVPEPAPATLPPAAESASDNKAI
jgi:hypothetical protein